MATSSMIFVILVILKSVTSSTLNLNVAQMNKIFHGRYTRDVNNPELIVPRHVHHDGKFKSFALPSYYSRDEINAKRKRSSPFSSLDTKEDKLHLILPFNGKDHHIELSPYHDFISPEMVIETRGVGVGTNITEGLRFKRATDEQCHYRGFIRGHPNSRAALSLCDGVAGYVKINDGRYFIEPLDNSLPGSHGQHVHMIYKRDATHQENEMNKTCGTGDDWETAWAEQLAQRERHLSKNGNLSTLKRGSEGNVSTATHSIHRYIELALVADQRFMEYWRGTDFELYLLTLLNMVADLYHDASIGNLIDVVVVRMIYLIAEAEENLHITSNADADIITFSEWAYSINSPHTDHPSHFDIAVLISRRDFCKGGIQCGLAGIAHVAVACDPTKAAALVEDRGLIAGITITHEVGHVIGALHDELETTGCPPIDTDGSSFIMAPLTRLYSLRWSICSRQTITIFLNSPRSDCLINDPKDRPIKYQYPNMLPGAMYGSDFQCHMIAPTSVTCDLGGFLTCDILWCDTGSRCFSRNSPPAEGTRCGPNKWCIRKKCVPMGSRPSAINGGWGNWRPSGLCSRTCGGGVHITERECDNPRPSNGGRYCLGERRRIDICNVQPCDPSRPSFRASQCSEHDFQNSLKDGLRHTWHPVIKDDLEACMLYCINEYKKLFQMGLIKDGTPCKSGTNNMCISGRCRKVGCDWVLDSGAIEDRCHICQGDGTQCTVIEGDYNETKGYGYAKVVTIPKSAKGIKVFERGPSQNSLAVKLEHYDDYCLNGDFLVTFMRELNCVGARLIYKGPESKQEEIEIKGPIHDDIQIQVLFVRGRNPGVHYQYILPKPTFRSYKPKFLWDFTQWSDCDVNCGGGTMISTPNCLEESNGIVSESYCKDLSRPPPKVRICNDHPCLSKWRVSEWSKCSACKGHQGEQTRKVQCIKSASRSKDDDIEVNSKYCKGSAPKQIKQCKGTKPCRPTSHQEPKPTIKRTDISSPVKKSILKNSGKMNKLNKKDLMRYLDEADDKDNGDSEINEDTKDELKKILHEWLLEHKNKRMCGVNKYVIEVETNEIKITPEGSTARGESELTSSEAQIESSTIKVGLESETTDAELTVTSIKESQQGENVVTEEGNTEIKSLSTLKPGTLIKDEYPADETVLIEAPIKDDYSSANLSDIAFQENGDSPRVQIDRTHEKIYRGPEARKRINEMAYGNITDITDLPDGEATAEDFV